LEASNHRLQHLKQVKKKRFDKNVLVKNWIKFGFHEADQVKYKEALQKNNWYNSGGSSFYKTSVNDSSASNLLPDISNE
jgi:hypothetical protein